MKNKLLFLAVLISIVGGSSICVAMDPNVEEFTEEETMTPEEEQMMMEVEITPEEERQIEEEIKKEEAEEKKEEMSRQVAGPKTGYARGSKTNGSKQ